MASALALAGCAGGRGAQTQAAAAPVGPNPQVLLLGEVHDNAQGHRLRYELLRQRVEGGWRPAIVMEQFDREDQDLLNKAQKGCLDAQCVIRVVNGARWDWQLYYPVIQLALDFQLPLVAGNLSRADASRVVRDGVSATFDPKHQGLPPGPAAAGRRARRATARDRRRPLRHDAGDDDRRHGQRPGRARHLDGQDRARPAAARCGADRRQRPRAQGHRCRALAQPD